MNKASSVLLIISALLVLSGCQKKDNIALPSPGKGQPEVEILDPLILENGGLRLAVKVNSVPMDMVYAYSLIISKDSMFQDIAFSSNFELPMRVKTYQYDLLAGLEQDIKYYYTYSINGSRPPQSQQKKSFLFGKESKVSIDSIAPKKAGIGDTLRVYGNFKDYQFIKATLGDSTMRVVGQTDKVVEILLDQKTPMEESIVSLYTNYQRTIAQSLFSLVKPTIVSIPLEASVGEEITIHGVNFSKYNGQNKVFINDVEVQVNSFSNTQLKVTIPKTIKSVLLNIQVYSQKQTASTDKILKIRTAKIIESPSVVRLNEHYNLKLEDLPEVPLEIRIGDQPVTIQYRQDQGGYNYIGITPKIAIYTNKNPQLTITYLDETLVLSEHIEILDRWELIATSLPFAENTALSSLDVGGDIYVVATGKDVFTSGSYFLWKFDDSSNTFSRIDIPYAMEGGTVSAYQGIIYVYTGTIADNFCQYDTRTGTWQKLANYPSSQRYGGVMNSVAGNIYITTGYNQADFGNVRDDNSLQRYNISSNQWMRMEDYPTSHDPIYGNRYNATSMVIADELYVLAGGRTTGNRETFAFNPRTNKWIQKADLEPAMYAAAIVKSGYGIVLSKYSLKRYDATADTWQQLDEYLLPKIYGSDHGFTFFTTGSYLYSAYDGIFFKIKLTNLLP